MANTKKLFYIGERINPQFPHPYYIKFGQLSKKDAMKKTNCVYGNMNMFAYETEEEYESAANIFKNAGYNIR